MAHNYYIGLMSGTSMDGLDVALVAFSHERGPQLVATHQHDLPAPLRAEMEALCQPSDGDLDRAARVDQLFAEVCAEAVAEILQQQQLRAEDITAIGSHGQTLRHQPNATPAYTIQIGDANLLAVRTGINVVADFRRKDIALGGQGAPLVPAFHQYLFASNEAPRAILNLGGIANITWLPGSDDQVSGFDTGPANTLLDNWFRHCHPEQVFGFDKNGQFAASGKCRPDLLEALLADPYFHKRPPKSTGRDDFHVQWLLQRFPTISKLPPADVQQTLQHLTAASIANACRAYLPTLPETLFVCGGGALNADLLRVCRDYLPEVNWRSTAALDVAPEWVEAMAFAWLAWCHVNGRTGNLPAVTGASRPAILGALFPYK